MKTVAELTDRLGALHRQTQETPLFNPVFQLALDLSRSLEAGEIDLAAIEGMIAELECEALMTRAGRLRRLVAPVAPAENEAAIEGCLDSGDFDAFRAAWENPQLHAVFTAHPTFLLPPAQSEAVATAAASEGEIDETACAIPAERPAITLAFEHRQAMAAMARGQDARDRIVARLLDAARERWPDRWHEFAPLPFRFATWVGYDMDGRTDIGWHTSIGFRLAEKAERLARYAESLAAIDDGHALLETLRAARDHTAECAGLFAEPLDDPAALSAAANRLTADDPAKLLSLEPLVERLEGEAREAGGERAVALKTLAAAMRADGLGMGGIHFRVNAKQLHNAIRRRLDEAGLTVDLASQGALGTLRDLIAGAEPLRSNFAALAIESSTAIRQFLAMAQILRHIDADAPIRMLIAECEQPATVLAAVYFARLFGVEDKVDVSPLFETETALEHGGRFLDALLADDIYRDYARRRGRVCIQTGFSDAGRFVGQIPASLAIERLQGRLAEAMAANGLTDVAALIFDTHGESMGRGAHPGGFADRLEWPLSPWARRRFARAGIRLEPEVSFQGGDGYLFFANPELALATLTRIAQLRPAETAAGAPADPFYRRTDLSLDFYRAIRDHQNEHLESATYSRAVTAFGLGLLNATGSRVSRRQSDLSSDREMSLRQIRAIPHNAILQQLGYPVNVIAGFGSAAEGNREEIAALLADSARGRQMVRLVRASNALASIKTVAAFGELYNSAYWASRTYRGTERDLAEPCAALAEYLVKDDRAGVFRRLASRLRIDALKLHQLLDLLPDEAPIENREDVRRRIGVLQALRLALLQHMFLRAVSVPAFSRANDISRRDVIEMVLTLRVEDALAQLRRAFPTRFPGPSDYVLDEPSDYPDHGAGGYAAIEAEFIAPIERAHALNLRIATAIANEFGAHG
ncbi:phosphoenolpyruvate carboxylase [Pelagerythrobacter marinus]|uniref:phosphoenolpyruvate carboxylase n=1 Tax=Pelagerythrobacter marinus TaxID=538382 RepID=UPI002036A79E|nr:phosphoenolpyruvate carboxylase [Pelagerythrobacter marinus]USA39848.1 phosphoenolpyruvate carboxylase [Pelagerythrobacter marinus]WPZ06021.1 phosphoenolpyruvate carboxylase [Pelagerythrobacter marinus]